MKYRKLRIAWSVAWLGFAGLTVGFWVRSYHIVDVVWYPAPLSTICCIDSRFGTVHIAAGESGRIGWTVEYLTSEQLRRAYEEDGFNTRPNRIGIGFTHAFQYTILSLPHWLIAMMTVAVAFVPWLGYRFSLRTLLIVTTLVAVGLGFAVWAARK